MHAVSGPDDQPRKHTSVHGRVQGLDAAAKHLGSLSDVRHIAALWKGDQLLWKYPPKNFNKLGFSVYNTHKGRVRKNGLNYQLQSVAKQLPLSLPQRSAHALQADQRREWQWLCLQTQ